MTSIKAKKSSSNFNSWVKEAITHDINAGLAQLDNGNKIDGDVSYEKMKANIAKRSKDEK